MNKPSAFSRQLQTESVPLSPASLDERILDYSRQHVPDRNLPFISPWVSVFATCSVMGIALLLVLRTSVPTAFEDIPVSFEPSYESVSDGVTELPVKLRYRSFQTTDKTDNKGKTEEAEPMVEIPAATIPRISTAQQPSHDNASVAQFVSNRRSAHVADDNQKSRLRALRRLERISVPKEVVILNLEDSGDKPAEASRNDTVTGGIPGSIDDTRDDSIENLVKKMQDERRDNPRNEAVQAGTLVEAFVVTSNRFAMIEKGEFVRELSDEETGFQLQRLRYLLENGQVENARAGYRQLLKQCVHCQLPGTLELAIQELQTRQASKP